MSVPYPEAPAARDRWILARREPRAPLDPRRPYAALVEQERSESGEIVPVATVFLTNRECPWRCLMCDLWKQTLAESVPPGAIPAQLAHARAQLGPARQLKLYNNGSFFDPRAIPPGDYPAIAAQARDYERVIVECHPALVGPAVVGFRDLLSGQLEVAMGLETAHPEVLEKLNKRMTLEQFARAAAFLRQHGIALRVFLLVHPPFLTDAAEARLWTRRSMEFAYDCDATVASLIATRTGNGALDALAAVGMFAPPRLGSLETAQEDGLALRRGRVFADVWDLAAFSDCAACFPQRAARLARLNLSQAVEPRIACACAERRTP